MSPEVPPPETGIERGLYGAYEIGIVLKGINAALEILFGIILLAFGNVLSNLLVAFVQNELIEDPTDFFATHIHDLITANPSIDTFGGLYLLSHGLVKGLLIVALLRNAAWAYPASLVVFALFVMYQVIRWFSTHSLILIALTVFDLAVMWLIWHEWRRRSSALVQ